MEIISLRTGLLSVNSYIVPAGNGTVFVTDPGGNPDLIFNTCAKNSVHPKAVVLTHGHFDHIGALNDMYAQSVKNNEPISIIAHRADSRYFGPGSLSVHSQALESLGFDNISDFLTCDAAQPDTILKGGEILFGKWKVIHTPGHSPGSVCLYSSEDKVLLSGDTLFYGTWGRTDLDGGNEKDMQNSLELLFTLPPDTRVYPGHGGYGFLLSETFK